MQKKYIILVYNFRTRIASKVRFCVGHKSFYPFGIHSCLATTSRQSFNDDIQCRRRVNWCIF